MDTESISYRTLKNIIYSFLGYIAPIVFSVFVTPLMVIKLGVTDFGVYVLANSVINFMFMVDLGLGSAITKLVSEFLGKEDFISIQELINTANSLFLIIGIFGLVVFTALGKWGLNLFKISVQSQEHVFIVFVFAGFVFAFSCFVQLYVSLLRAIQRFDITVKLSLLQMVLVNIIIIPLLFLGFKLKVFFLVTALTTALLAVVLNFKFYSNFSNIKFRFGWNWQMLKQSYKFGFVVFLNTYFFTMLAYFDRLVIPSFLGPSVLSYYTLPANIAEKTNGITGSSAAVFFPLISTLQGQGKYETIKNVYRRYMRIIIILAFGMSITIAVFARPIMHYWLGEEFAQKSTNILIILAATYFCISVYGALTNILFGLGENRFVLKWTIFMSIINLITLFWWMPKYGIIGAAWAYFFGILPGLLAVAIVERRILKLPNVVQNYTKLTIKLIITGSIFYAMSYYFISPLIHNFFTLVGLGSTFGLVFFLLYKILGFVDKEDREVLFMLISMVKNKFSNLKTVFP